MLKKLILTLPIMNRAQRIVISIALPAVLLVVILSWNVYQRSTGDWDARTRTIKNYKSYYWHAYEQWWVWLAAIALVTGVLLWLWRRR